MANIIGAISINQNRILELDAHPLSSPTSDIVVGDLCVGYGFPGLWQKSGPGSYDFIRIDFESAFFSQATVNGDLVLTNTSNNIQAFTNGVSGQAILLPDATTLPQTHQFVFFNDSVFNLSIKNFLGTEIYVLRTSGRVKLYLANNGSQAGIWLNNFSGPPQTKTGYVLNSYFSGNPKVFDVAFTEPFPDNNYSVSVSSSVDGRIWQVESQTLNGFRINSQANAPLNGMVYWSAGYGESK